MAQFSYLTIDPFTETGTDLANDLNSFATALYTSHSGATKPSYAVQGTIWSDTSVADKSSMKFYDGSDSIKLYEIDRVANTHTPFVLELDLQDAGASQQWKLQLGAGDAIQVKDVTGGNLIPFLIEIGAPTNSAVIEGAGSLGLGVVPPSANAQLYVGDTGNIAMKEQASDPASQDSTYGVIYVLTTNSELRYQDDGGTSFIIAMDGKALVFTKMQRYSIGTPLTQSPSGTLTWDVEADPHAKHVLTANITTFTINNLKEGSEATIEMIQDGAGGAYTVAWPNTRILQSGGGAAPVMTTTNDAVDLYTVYGKTTDKGVLVVHPDVKAIS